MQPTTVASYVRVTFTLQPGARNGDCNAAAVLVSDDFSEQVEEAEESYRVRGGLECLRRNLSRVSGSYRVNMDDPTYSNPSKMRALRRGKEGVLMEELAGPGSDDAKKVINFMASLTISEPKPNTACEYFYPFYLLHMSLGFDAAGVPHSSEYFKFVDWIGSSEWRERGLWPIDATPLRSLNLKHLGEMYIVRVLSLDDDCVGWYEFFCLPREECSGGWQRAPRYSPVAAQGLEPTAPPSSYLVDLANARIIYRVTALLPKALSVPRMRRESLSCRLDKVGDLEIPYLHKDPDLDFWFL